MYSSRVWASSREFSSRICFTCSKICRALLLAARWFPQTCRPVYPETVDDTWGLIASNLTSNVPFSWRSFQKFDGTSVSECDGRIRNFLAADYASSFDGQTVRISHSGSGPAWFILRTNEQAVDTVEGGSAIQLERCAYLIEAREPEVTATLRVSHDALD